MATDRALKADLLSKLGIQPSALSKRVKRVKQDVPMSTEEATYVIAHREGLQIDQYLDRGEVDRVRTLYLASERQKSKPPRPTPAPETPKQVVPREIKFPGEFKASDPLLGTRKLNQAVAMAKMYPVFYVIENSIRTLIKRVMEDAHGVDWWDTQLTKGKLKNVRQKATARATKEKSQSWHQRRGAHPIDYVDIKDLETLILAKQHLFIPDIIPQRPWFEQFMRELYPSRNVICHMNPLDSDNVKDMRLRLKKWQKLINGALNNIPP